MVPVSRNPSPPAPDHKIMRLSACLLLLSSPFCFAGKSAKIEPYAVKGRLTMPALVEFIIDYRDISYNEMRPGPGAAPTFESKLAYSKVNDTVSDILGDGWSTKSTVTVEQVRAHLPAAEGAVATYGKQSAWRKWPPVTTPFLTQRQTFRRKDGTAVEHTFRGTVEDLAEQKEALKKADPTINVGDETETPWRRTSLGPFRLRKSVDSVFNYVAGDDNSAFYKTESAGNDKGLLSAPGAKITFSDDRLVANGRKWSTEGALIFSYHSASEFPVNAPGTPRVDGWEVFHAALAGAWKVERAESSGTYSVNELKFSAPLVYGSSSLFGFVQLNPYYQTDTDFDGEVFGATASYELSGAPCFGRFSILKEFGKRELDYRVRVAALLDYSEVHRVSAYSPRKDGDDWLRAGGEVGLELGYFDKTEPGNLPVTAGVSYRMMDSLGGVDDNGHLLKANLSWWLNPFACFTLSYERGETPVAAKDVDMFSVGVELRY